MFSSIKYNLRLYLFNIQKSKLFSWLFKHIEYHNFPFQEFQPLSNRANEKIAEYCKYFEDNSVNYVVSWGTALGLYRDGCIIPHDTDIDVDILDYSNPSKIIHDFKGKGWILGRYVSHKNQYVARKKVQQLTFYDSDNIIYDMLLWYDTGCDIITNYSESKSKLRLQKKYYSSYEYRHISGFRFRFPKTTENYLVELYGIDWKIPKSEKGDWTDDCNIIDDI